MITARFYRSGQQIVAFDLSGHAGFARYGKDIVCAAVTSAVQLTANAITEQLEVPATVTVGEDQISLELPAQHETASLLLEALLEHLTILSEDYPNTIKIIILFRRCNE